MKRYTVKVSIEVFGEEEDVKALAYEQISEAIEAEELEIEFDEVEEDEDESL